MNNKSFDLEERLVQFAADNILFLNYLPQTIAGVNLTDQLTRSATSSALNFGEAQGAITVKDKVHKLSIVLKELKESRVALKILTQIDYGSKNERAILLDECEQLVAIIASIIKSKMKK